MIVTKKLVEKIMGKDFEEEEEKYILCSKCNRPIYVGERAIVTGYHLDGKYYGHPQGKC